MVFTTTDENPPGLFSRQYHRVLNRAVWSSLEGSRLLLVLLVSILAPAGPLIMGLDETLERRRGAKIQAKGIDRDPVRSSHSHMVKASGLRWLSLMFLVPIPWAKRVWALPFLTVLAPSERYHQERGQRHQKLTDWARQMFLVVRRWLPARALVAVTDRSFAVITLLWRIRHLPNLICSITRLRLDAALYEPAPPRKPRQTGRPRLKGKRLLIGARFKVVEEIELHKIDQAHGDLGIRLSTLWSGSGWGWKGVERSVKHHVGRCYNAAEWRCSCRRKIGILRYKPHGIHPRVHGKHAQGEISALGEERSHAKIGVDSLDLGSVHRSVAERRNTPVIDTFTRQIEGHRPRPAPGPGGWPRHGRPADRP